MSKECLLQVQNVTKRYGDKIALNDFSMDICPGEIVALIGENGAGKTTLLNIICGYIRPSAGQVQYKGENIIEKPLTIREFGILIEPQFLDYISAEENLRLLSQLVNRKQDTRIEELLEKTELYSSRKKKVKEFSFGMKQRLGLCQCLLTEVGFIILDEPFVGLDPIGKEIFKQTIMDIAHKQNVPVLFSSHDLDDVDQICDRLVMISKGNKQLDQPLEHKDTCMCRHLYDSLYHNEFDVLYGRDKVSITITLYCCSFLKYPTVHILHNDFFPLYYLYGNFIYPHWYS